MRSEFRLESVAEDPADMGHICAISPPPSLYDKALIIRGFSFFFWKNLPAHTSAHNLDEVLLFDLRLIFQMVSCPYRPEERV